jgi:hypothetical protein
MSSMESYQRGQPSQKLVLTFAWLVTLSVSLLPNILWRTLTGQTPTWLFPSKLALLGALVVAGFFWRPLRLLCVYCLMLAILFLADLLRGRLEGSTQWQQWFGSGFTNHMLGSQVLRVGVAAVMIAGLLLLRYRAPGFLPGEGRPERNGRANPRVWYRQADGMEAPQLDQCIVHQWRNVGFLGDRRATVAGFGGPGRTLLAHGTGVGSDERVC